MKHIKATIERVWRAGWEYEVKVDGKIVGVSCYEEAAWKLMEKINETH